MQRLNNFGFDLIFLIEFSSQHALSRILNQYRILRNKRPTPNKRPLFFWIVKYKELKEKPVLGKIHTKKGSNFLIVISKAPRHILRRIQYKKLFDHPFKGDQKHVDQDTNPT